MLRAHRCALALAAAVVLAGGCPTTPLLVNARPLGHGKNAVIVAGSVYGISLASVGSSGGSSAQDTFGLLTVPTLDIMYRRGIGEHFDLGIALTGWGKVAVDGKINLLNSPAFALSLDPGIGGFFAGAGDVGGGYLQFSVPLLIDIAFSPTVRLTLAPTYSGIYAFASASSGSSSASSSAYSHLIGGSVALEFALGTVFRLQPFGGVQWFYNPAVETAAGSAKVDAALVWFNAGLAAKFVF